MRIGVAKNKKKIFVYFHKKNIELHPLWLRERVSCKDLLDVNTGQRLYDPSILNHKLKIQNASIKNRNLNISFSDGIKSDYQIGDLLNEINKNLLNNNGFIIIHRHKKDTIKISQKLKIFETRLYGISKVYFGN